MIRLKEKIALTAAVVALGGIAGCASSQKQASAPPSQQRARTVVQQAPGTAAQPTANSQQPALNATRSELTGVPTSGPAPLSGCNCSCITNPPEQTAPAPK